MSEFDAQVTFCSTRDLDAAARFYEELIGLELVLDQGKCRIWRVAGDAYQGFCARREAPRPDGVILTLVTRDVDGCHARLAARGVEFEQPPRYNAEFDIYHCFIRDPDGYLVEVQRFESADWPG